MVIALMEKKEESNTKKTVKENENDGKLYERARKKGEERGWEKTRKGCGWGGGTVFGFVTMPHRH